jgi:hypothetical protein
VGASIIRVARAAARMAGGLGGAPMGVGESGARAERERARERAEAAEAARVANLSDAEVSVPAFSWPGCPHNHTGSVSGVYIF